MPRSTHVQLSADMLAALAATPDIVPVVDAASAAVGGAGAVVGYRVVPRPSRAELRAYAAMIRRGEVR